MANRNIFTNNSPNPLHTQIGQMIGNHYILKIKIKK